MADQFRFGWVNFPEEFRGYTTLTYRDSSAAESYTMYGSIEDFHDKMSSLIGDTYTIRRSAWGYPSWQFYNVTRDRIKELQDANPTYDFKAWCMLQVFKEDEGNQWWLVFVSPEDETFIMDYLKANPTPPVVAAPPPQKGLAAKLVRWLREFV